VDSNSINIVFSRHRVSVCDGRECSTGNFFRNLFIPAFRPGTWVCCRNGENIGSYYYISSNV